MSAAQFQRAESSLAQESPHGQSQRGRVSCLAFPNGKHGPKGHFEGCDVLGVPFPVSLQFWCPVIAVRSRYPPVRAAWVPMLMPEASVHKDHLAARRKYKVGLARKILAMQPITVAHSVDKAANQHFGLHALALDAPHVFGAVLGGELVHHRQLVNHAFSSHECVFNGIAWGHSHHFFAVQPM